MSEVVTAAVVVAVEGVEASILGCALPAAETQVPSATHSTCVGMLQF